MRLVPGSGPLGPTLLVQILPKIDQSGGRRPEAAAPIELRELRLEVDVQPMCAALPGEVLGLVHKARCDASPAKVWVNTGVEDEGMKAAIPCDIHKADDRLAIVGTYMPKTAGQDVGK